METAKELVRVFLGTDFAGGRHTQRIAKIESK
jgi:ribose 5-phosphate isomerase RpiB